jgi:hypothetical protein
LSSWYLSFFNFAALSDAAPATKLIIIIIIIIFFFFSPSVLDS